jgi:hypothetical protein
LEKYRATRYPRVARLAYFIPNSRNLALFGLLEGEGLKNAIIIDASRDVASQKHLCPLVRFLSDIKQVIVTEFFIFQPAIKYWIFVDRK